MTQSGPYLYNPGYINPNQDVANIDDGDGIQAAVVGRLYSLKMFPKLTSINGYNHLDKYTLTSLSRLPTVLISWIPDSPFHLARTSHFIENQSHKGTTQISCPLSNPQFQTDQSSTKQSLYNIVRGLDSGQELSDHSGLDITSWNSLVYIYLQ